MHRDRVSPASPLATSEAASPPCRSVLAYQWRYGRCIEIRSHRHRHWRHRGAASAARRPVLVHQRRYSRCIEIRSHRHRHWRHQGAASAACRPVLVHQRRYSRRIEIRSHRHRHWRHQGAASPPCRHLWATTTARTIEGLRGLVFSRPGCLRIRWFRSLATS